MCFFFLSVYIKNGIQLHACCIIIVLAIISLFKDITTIRYKILRLSINAQLMHQT